MKRHLHFSLFLIVLLPLVGLTYTSCQDNINDSDLYSFKGETVQTYLEKTPEYSNFYYLITRTRLSKKSQSTLSTLLNTRGHFTVFAPTNEAVQTFLDSVYMTTGYDIQQTPDSMAEYITKNAIINNGDKEAYKTTDFQIGALEQTNMEDRYIMINYSTASENNQSGIIVNSSSNIIQPNIEVENGEIHGIDKVLRLSRATLSALIDEAPNLRVFSKLLSMTSWSDTLDNVRDEDYEENHSEYGADLDGTSQALNPEHRYYGFTVFTEPDELLTKKWGLPELKLTENGTIENWEEILPIVNEKCKEYYPNATSNDPKSQDNALNQFVAYHILPMRMAWDKLIIHYIELGYAYNNPNNLSINCHEYYETVGKHHRLMKLTEGATTNGKRINRYVKQYDYSDYTEKEVGIEGIKISETNGNEITNSLNGFYYPIDDILYYGSDVPGKVLNERLRWDFASLFSELITNGMRRISDTKHYPIPPGYFERMTFSNESRCVYLPYYGSESQGNYQADEFNIRGQYDFVLRLPPVPNDGNYELRICAPCNSSFGMAQFYFGTDKNNLSAVGLPVDLRISQDNPTIGWEADTDDDLHDNENDKNMRNNGYMKPPMHDCVSANGSVAKDPMRNNSKYRNRLRLRKIIWTGYAKNSETYYIRVKSLLTNPQACYLLDYMEWVPKNVYNGPTLEDRW